MSLVMGISPKTPDTWRCADVLGYALSFLFSSILPHIS